jgi:hypothetical protein
VLTELQDECGEDLYFRDGEHASAIGDYLVAMVLTKVITGKLPKQDFLKAYDFTIPGESWFPVNESVEDEVVTIPQNVADIIRRHI